MLVGITTSELSHQYQDERVAIQRYSQIGFDALDYSYDLYAYPGSCYATDTYLEYARALKKALDENHIKINQLHAPLFHHRVDQPMSISQAEEEAFLKKMTLRSFEVAHILGSSYIVMHPRKFKHYKTLDEQLSLRKYNINMYKEYIPLIQKYGIKIAIENMFVFDAHTHTPVDTALRTAQEMVSYIEELGEQYFVACLDTGHANINGFDPSMMAKVLGKHLKVLHVHDNYAYMDQHLICGLGTIDWPLFINTLREISFDGVFSLETNGMTKYIEKEACDMCVQFEYKVVKELLKITI